MADAVVNGMGAPQAGLGRRAMLRLGLAALTVIVLTVQGPWGTFRLPVVQRGVEFLLCTVLWEVFVPLFVTMIRGRLDPRFADTPLPLAGAVLLVSVPATACTVGLIWAVGGQVAILSFYAQSLLLGFVIAFARRGLVRGWTTPQAVTAPAAVTLADPAAGFLNTHAPALARRTLLALEAEDHYLRVHTDGGTALILMRLRDAMAILGAGAGWQPHRSYWLATGVAATAERKGQSWQLVLTTGLAVPVSRSSLAAMRDAGYGART